MRTINRILVANRGEIALRVCRTATDMGISTIAVYADQDMAAPHTREADEALSLGGDDAASTYLNGEKILAIALETGADAIHPGYGFLSENSEFARAVEDAGMAWPLFFRHRCPGRQNQRSPYRARMWRVPGSRSVRTRVLTSRG